MPLPNGAAIKAIRLAKGLKGVDVARVAGVTHGHFFNIENADRRKHASDGVLAGIAKALEVPVAAITVPEPEVQRTRRPPAAKQAA